MDFQSWDNGLVPKNNSRVSGRKMDNRILITAFILLVLVACVIIIVIHPKLTISAWDGCTCIESDSDSILLKTTGAERDCQYVAILLPSQQGTPQLLYPAENQKNGGVLKINTTTLDGRGMIFPIAYQADQEKVLIGKPIEWKGKENQASAIYATPSVRPPTPTATSTGVQTKLYATSNVPVIQFEAFSVDGTNNCQIQLQLHINKLNPQMTYQVGFMIAQKDKRAKPVGDRGYALGVSEADFVDLVVLPAQDAAKEHVVMAYVYIQSTDEMYFSEQLTFVPKQLKAATLKPTATIAKSTPTPTSIYSRITPTPTSIVMPTPVRTSNVTPIPTPKPTHTPPPSKPMAELFYLYDEDTRYYYQQLTPKEKRCFAAMYDAICARKATVDFSEEYTENECLRAVDVLYFDCPELLDCFAPAWYINPSSNQIYKCDFYYDLTIFDHERYLSQMTGIFDRIAMNHYSDYDREIALFIYIKENTVYDNTTDNSISAIGTFIEGRARCCGYARAAALGLRYLGIPCACVTGFTYEEDGSLASIGHEWLIVQIDGQWYQCDPTWDDPDGDNYFEDADLHYLPYTNITDAMMDDERLTNNYIWFSTGFSQPVCNSTAANYYKREGCFIPRGTDAAAAYRMAMINAADNGEKGIVLFFESPTDLEQFVAAQEFTMRIKSASSNRDIYFEYYTNFDSGLFYVEGIYLQ